MKKIFAICGILFAFTFTTTLTSCGGDSHDNVSVNVTQEVATQPADKNFDLEELSRLLQEEKPSGGWTAEALHNLVNGDINNLDLDGNGQTDKIKVDPFKSEDGLSTGFTLTAELADGSEQTIGNVTIERESTNATTANMTVSGDPHVYGEGHHYHCHGLSVGDVLFMHWLLSPRYPYYGFYGGWSPMWAPRPIVTTTVYCNNVARRNTMRTSNGSRISQPTRTTANPVSPRAASLAASKAKTSNNVAATLRNPTQAQKSFAEKTAAARNSQGSMKRTRNMSNQSNVENRSNDRKNNRQNTGNGGGSKNKSKPSRGRRR